MRIRIPIRLPAAFATDDDRALLGRFAEAHDDAAFAALMGRHARMVYGVCRRAVRDEHLAEDAFQAVFLVLAKNPGGAVAASSVGGWLFGIARRVGMAAKRQARRHAGRAGDVSPLFNPTQQGAGSDFDDLLRVLDEELAALPETYRAPLVACFLEERTQDEAAKQLGWSLSTLRRRLDRGKELLRARLVRRGATLAGGLFAGSLAPSAGAAVPSRLLHAAANPSPVAQCLAAEITRGAVGVKFALAAAALLALGGIGFALTGNEEGNREVATPARPAVAPMPRVEQPAWVTVTGRVVFPAKRDIPAVKAVPLGAIKDAKFFGQPLENDLLIDPKTRGLANAVVWLRPDSDDTKAVFPKEKINPKRAAAKAQDRTITAGADGYTPHVTAARAGDRLIFTNPTPIAFNVRYQVPLSADRPEGPMEETGEFNVLLPNGMSYTTKPLSARRGASMFTDFIHPWIKGYVWTFEHPYFAVTDAKGNFTIPDAPAGKWRLVIWQEKVGYANGAKGRTGERVTIGPGDAAKLGDRMLESDNWNVK